MKHKEFKFEDFTLIMSRNCNLACVYCPLEHFPWNMEVEVIKEFFDNLFHYKDYYFYITLFGGEALLNRKGISFMYEYLIKNQEIINWRNLKFEIKIVTNGTLIDEYYLDLFNKFNNINFIDFLIDISIDWWKETQLSQRNYKSGYLDYYWNLSNNVLKLIDLGINVELFLVIDFNNSNVIADVLYLIKEFKRPIFLMPVDLSYDAIYDENWKIKSLGKIEEYIKKIWEIILFIRNNNIISQISNFKANQMMDIKLPPIWPTIDYGGDIYVTRDFLFMMDKSSKKFSTIWNIFSSDFSEVLNYIESNFEMLQKDSLHTYYGRTYLVNKKIWDYFTRLVYT